jgi:hypothetical protein
LVAAFLVAFFFFFLRAAMCISLTQTRVLLAL